MSGSFIPKNVSRAKPIPRIGEFLQKGPERGSQPRIHCVAVRDERIVFRGSWLRLRRESLIHPEDSGRCSRIWATAMTGNNAASRKSISSIPRNRVNQSDPTSFAFFDRSTAKGGGCFWGTVQDGNHAWRRARICAQFERGGLFFSGVFRQNDDLRPGRSRTHGRNAPGVVVPRRFRPGRMGE